MRGSDALARIPANHPIRMIRRIANEVLAGFDAAFTAMSSGIGRPSIERLRRRYVTWRTGKIVRGRNISDQTGGMI